jgi:hypothetical protein
MHTLFLILSLALANAAKPPAAETEFQLGEQWDKHPAAISPAAQSVFKISFFLGKATATYLGKFNDNDLFLTVNHIVGDLCPRQISKDAKRSPLVLKNELVSPDAQWRCKKVLFQQNDIDTAIIAVEPDNASAQDLLAAVPPARMTQVPTDLRAPLALLGYGSFDNPSEILKEEDGVACVMLAPYGPQLIPDPDREWHAKDRVWSMPIGCDSSRGDSGGPAFLRGTNLIAGIVWTGGYRGRDLKDVDLIQVFEKAPKRLWTDFTYIVPATAILKRISGYIGGGELNSDDRRTLFELHRARHYGD